MKRRIFINRVAVAGMAMHFPLQQVYAKDENIRIGIIGLDTSHSPAFTKLFNGGSEDKVFEGLKVVAAYPYGSREIQSSASRIPRYTEEVKDYGVEIVDSIETLLKNVDVVLLETNDGRPRKQQAFHVIESRKPMFIDKPVAASLQDVASIYKYANEKGVPIFSTSSLRYMQGVAQVRYENKIGKVLGAETFSPATLEPSHPDLFWYGIHGVEILFAVMGPGCESVTRFNEESTDVVVGRWKDGRIGTFRGTREGKHNYGGIAFGSDGNLVLGPYEGYGGLVRVIADFFRTRKPPVEERETLEIYAFMEAADESKRRGGSAVKISEVLPIGK